MAPPAVPDAPILQLVEGTRLVPARSEPHPVFRARANRIKYVAELMASGIYRRGRTARELAAAWGMPSGTVYGITSEASRLVKCAVNPDELTRTITETIDELLEVAHEAKRSGETRESIVAFGKAAELCSELMKTHGQGDEQKPLSDQDAFKQLVAMGWTPPCTLHGLPMPTVMGPEGFGHNDEGSEDIDHENG